MLPAADLSNTAIVFLRTTWHFVLTMLPAFALPALLAWRGMRDAVLLALAGLVAIAAQGYLAFWLWFLSPRIGHAVSFLLPVVEIGWLLWVSRKFDAPARAALKVLARPAILVFAASVLVLSAGFLYGGMQTPLATPWARFSHPLPPDNILPFLFAEEVRIGHVSKPFFEGFTSSDRPPLQAGIALSQYPFLPRPRELGYTALGVILQSLWIYAVWILLSAWDIEPAAKLLIVSVILFSGFTFLNSFFVWPKLLAAALMTGFSTFILIDKLWMQLRNSVYSMICAGALLSFGMLAHGGSAFALIGAVITAVALGRRLPLRSLALICGTSFIIYLPWLLYQKLYDPPGDRLLKLHLAGVEKPDNRSFSQALMDAYGRLTFSEFLHDKQANAAWVFDHEHAYWAKVSSLISALLHHDSMGTERAVGAASGARVLAFFHFVPNLGFLIVGAAASLAGLTRRFRSRPWRQSVRLWIYVICTLIPWCLIMYEPNATSIHQGTYVTVLLAFNASMLALWAVRPWLAFTAAALQIGLSLLVYGVYMRVPDQKPLNNASAGLLALGFLSIIVLFWIWLRRDLSTAVPDNGR